MGENGKLDGHGKLEEFVDVMLTKTKQEKDAEANFSISSTNQEEIVNENNLKEENPPTVDNIMSYISTLGLSALGLIGVGIYFKKKYFN